MNKSKKVSMTRGEYVVKNTAVSIVMQIVRNLLGFVSRTIFINILDAEYLGVNGLFSDILSMLSFAELGIGNAMTFSLYKPLADKNIEKIKSLMKLYATCYKCIGVVIAILGVCIVPFLNKIVGDVSYVKEDIVLLYLLFLLNSVLSYFFVYKKSLIIADQKNYIVEIYKEAFYALQVVVQSVFLVISKQFIAYLIIVVLFTFLNNYFMARKANKLYPYIASGTATKLEKHELKTIVKNVKALIVYKIGHILIDSTDSIFISMFINVITVGLYSNYKMVLNIFKTIGNTINGSVVASIGNLNATAVEEKKYSVFCEMFYLDVWFYGFTAVGLCVFLKEFISLWLGSGYTLGIDSVIAICVLYYISNLHYPCYAYRVTSGLFVFSKYIPLIAAVINIVLDIVFGMHFGLTGILLASIISRTLTYEIVDPIIIYKKVFGVAYHKYFLMYFLYTALVIGDGFLCYGLVILIPCTGLLGFIIKVVAASAAFNIIFVCATFRTSAFRNLLNRVKNFKGNAMAK